MSAPPSTASISSPQSPTVTTTASQTPATVSTAANLSQQLPHDDSPLEPPPTFPYAQTSGVASPSARTSHTRVDTITEDGEAQAVQSSGIVPQDRHSSSPDASPPGGSSEQSPVSQEDSPKALQESHITSTAVPAETGSAVPMASTTTGVDESQKASVQQQEVVPQTPQAFLTFLLVSGKRRTMSFEPETTIGRVKELIWNAWPSDWQGERPPAPSYLRVLYLGKMLQDDETLTKLKIPASLPNTPQPTIVHLSIRPYGPSGEDGTIKKKRKNSDALTGANDTDSGAGCCGCIIC